MPQRDDFSESVKRALAARVGNLCSNPGCRALTSGPHEEATKAVNLGVAAHITAAAPGGPRYDASLTPEQRSSVENALWLCQNCAKLIDSDPVRFAVSLLQGWKDSAEEAARSRLGKTGAPTPAGSVPTATGGSTFNINIQGSTIGGMAFGDGASATGSVSIGSPLPSVAPASPSPTRARAASPAMASASTTGLQSVYLSYSADDEPFVERLFHALEARGVATFYFPEHAPAGQKLHRTARVGVNGHDRVLLVCSRASLSDSRVQNDLEQTLEREAREGGSSRLIPVNLDNFARSPDWQPPHPDVIHEIQGRVMVDMVGAERDARKFEQAIDRLIRALRG